MMVVSPERLGQRVGDEAIQVPPGQGQLTDKTGHTLHAINEVTYRLLYCIFNPIVHSLDKIHM